jgi:hypothetical protein
MYDKSKIKYILKKDTRGKTFLMIIINHIISFLKLSLLIIVVGEPIDFFFEKNTIHLISVAYNLEFLD